MELGNSEQIAFGDLSDGNVCGKLDGESQVSAEVEEFSDFFLKQGDNKNQSGTTGRGQDKGRDSCYSTGASLQWSITVSDVNQQYLGLCGNDGHDKTKFIKKEKKQPEGEDKGTISVCSSDCGDFGEESGSVPPTLNQEKGGSGKKVLFYKNKSKG